MKKLWFSLILSSIALNGCATQKISTPTGKWVVINPAGYVPPNTPIYIKKAETSTATNDPVSSYTSTVTTSESKGL